MFRNWSYFSAKFFFWWKIMTKEISFWVNLCQGFLFSCFWRTQLLLKNVMPKLYNPLLKNQDNGKMEDVKVLCCQKVHVQKLDWILKKLLRRLSTSSAVLVLFGEGWDSGALLQCFKSTGDLTHTQTHTRQNSLERPELKARASFQHIIMEQRGLLKTPVKASSQNHSTLLRAVLLIKLKPLHKTPI